MINISGRLVSVAAVVSTAIFYYQIKNIPTKHLRRFGLELNVTEKDIVTRSDMELLAQYRGSGRWWLLCLRISYFILVTLAALLSVVQSIMLVY